MNALNIIKTLTPIESSLAHFLEVKSNKSVFHDDLKNFIDYFSKCILKDTRLKIYPDLISLAFWMRKSNINKLQDNYNLKNGLSVKAPVGRVIHFAPSNVDTIFIYSLFISLMLGNQNVVRVSSKSSPQRDILVELLSDILNTERFSFVQKYLLIVNYPHSQEITEYLCENSDLRVIWGGDTAVQTISQYSLPATANEVKFANKYSLSIINAAEIAKLPESEFDKLVTNFVNDSYWFSQQGCSSPRSIFWLNKKTCPTEVVKFWKAVEVKSSSMFFDEIDVADVMNKIVATNLLATELDQSVIHSESSMVTRVEINQIEQHNNIRELHCGAGLFIEGNLNSLSDLSQLVDRKTQTITYFGFDLEYLKTEFCINNIYPDRVVKIGNALEFSTIWDGYDLLQSMSRNVDFK